MKRIAFLTFAAVLLSPNLAHAELISASIAAALITAGANATIAGVIGSVVTACLCVGRTKP